MTDRSIRGVPALALAAIVTAACGGKLPETRYYQLAAAPRPGVQLAAVDPAPGAPADRPADRAIGDAVAAEPRGVLVLEPLATDPAYDDERIVYRTTPYRIDYYHYHRWSSAPGVLVGNFLEQALERSGRFRAVVREPSPDAPLVLGGRVLAIEEVDQSRTAWQGRIVLELAVSDGRTGELLWSRQFDESEPLARQTPEGLAQAISAAMSRIVAEATPVISELAARAPAALTDRCPNRAPGRLTAAPRPTEP